MARADADPRFEAAARETFLLSHAIAATVESVIILLILLTKALNPRSALPEGADGGTPLPPDVAPVIHEILDLLDTLIVEDGQVPEDGASDQRRRARDLAFSWNLPRAAGGEAMDILDIAPVHHTVLAARSAEARYFTVHHFSQKRRQSWAKAMRDLSATPKAAKERPFQGCKAQDLGGFAIRYGLLVSCPTCLAGEAGKPSDEPFN